jgi:hypothetical protein
MKFLAYAICTGLGFLLAQVLPDGPLAAFVPMLVSYHLFLAILVILSQKKTGFSLPLFQTLITHMAFLGLLVGLAVVREQIPFFGLIRYFIPSLAPFEANWLFDGSDRKSARELEVKPAFTSGTAEEYEEFRDYLTRAERRFRAPGLSVAQEYALWRTARARRAWGIRV